MILHRLREETRPHHDRLESRVDLLNAMAHREPYRRLLARFYGFYAPVEARLADYAPVAGDGLRLAERRKVALLRRDLLALGLTPERVDALPVCRDLPALTSFPAALGCLYVLEGATLGGQVIARRLRDGLDIGAENGGAFFLSYGERVARMWRDFGAFANDWEAAHGGGDAIVGAARETFETFEAWLCVETEPQWVLE